MNKVKLEKGLRVTVPKYNYNGRKSGKMRGTVIGIKGRYVLIQLDIGYKENFYFSDLHYIKE